MASKGKVFSVENRMYHIAVQKEDVAPYVLLPGDPHRVEQVAQLWDEARFVADNREHITYTGTYKGMPITCTSTGMGCPSTAIAVEELARCGATTLVRMGTCAGISEKVRRGDFVIFDSACRFDGTTRQYVDVEYPAVAHYEVVQAAIQAAREEGIHYHVGTSRCVDALYPRRPDRNACFGGYYRESWKNFLPELEKANVIAGDMESSAVLVLGRLFGLRSGCVCMCATNLLDAYRSGTQTNINDIPYGGDLIRELNHMAMETMYKIYLEDQKRSAE